MKFNVTIQRGSGVSIGRWLWWAEKNGEMVANGDEGSIEEAAAVALSTLVFLVDFGRTVNA